MSLRIRTFQNTIWKYYRAHGRDLPWRRTHDPYRILVSEIMLQQTQVERVLKFYPDFLKKFPNVRALAKAPLRDILIQWQGLGYNRRALNLKRAAVIVVRDYNGKLPRDRAVLESLPGIGSCTAGALLTFAYNLPAPFIETNIRRVFIHFFFPNRKNISDAKITPLVKIILERACPPKRPRRREWYYALMDYGAMLGRTVAKNPNRQSRHYTRQSKFEGSNRAVRGKIIKALAGRGSFNLSFLSRTIEEPQHRMEKVIQYLLREGLIRKKDNAYVL